MGATLNFHLFAVTYVSLSIQSAIGHTHICTDLQGGLAESASGCIFSPVRRYILVHDSATGKLREKCTRSFAGRIFYERNSAALRNPPIPDACSCYTQPRPGVASEMV